MKYLFASVAVAALFASSPASAACNPFNPSTCIGPQGPAGADGTNGIDGTNGVDGAPGVNGKDGTNGTNGAKGDTGPQGVTGKNGTNGINGRDFDSGENLALSSALSMPVWLGDKETVRFSGGVGISDEGNTAFGATGVLRLNQNWAAFAGGAVSDEGNGAGRAGLSFGF